LVRSSAAIDYRPVVISVAITVVIFLDDYSVPIPVFVAITDDCTVAISIAVMPSADCHAYRSDTDSNVFRARRHCSTNARNSGNNQSVFHRILLTLWKLRGLRSRTAVGSDRPRQTLKDLLRNDFEVTKLLIARDMSLVWLRNNALNIPLNALVCG
jgi:hypothetical protein